MSRSNGGSGRLDFHNALYCQRKVASSLPDVEGGSDTVIIAHCQAAANHWRWKCARFRHSFPEHHIRNSDSTDLKFKPNTPFSSTFDSNFRKNQRNKTI